MPAYHHDLKDRRVQDIIKEARDLGLPEGFLPQVRYMAHGTRPEPDSSEVYEVVSGLMFRTVGQGPWSPSGLPALPIKAHGKYHGYHSRGWDLPTFWAVDAKGNYWRGGHGHALTLFPVKNDDDRRGCLTDCEEDGEAEEIAKALGLKPRMPGWVKTAMSQGWTPPAGFDRDQFDKG